MSYYGKGWSYQLMQSSERISLVDYFINIIKEQFNSKLTTKNLYEILSRLNKEREEVIQDYHIIKETRDRLIGTGLDGIGAQMKFDLVSFSMSTYTDDNFNCLENIIKIIYEDKINKIMSSGKQSKAEKEFLMSIRGCTSIQELIERTKNISITLPYKYIISKFI